MASSAQLALVAATPTLVASNPNHDDVMRLVVTNTSTAVIYLGGPTVSATTGYSVAANGSVTLPLAQGDSLYAFSTAAGTASVLTSP